MMTMASKIKNRPLKKALDKELLTVYHVFVLALIILLAFFSGLYLGMQKDTQSPNTISVYNTCDRQPLAIHDTQRASMRLPAINRNGDGVAANLEVSVIPGSGLILQNLNRVLSKEETSQSIRTAAIVASNITGIDISNLDIIYDIYANASILEGPSAGAAITLVTIAALQDRQINDDVMITGTINRDGTIGPAGKIKEKALSAKMHGAKAFYVSVGASTELNYTEGEFCHVWGTNEYCQPELKTIVIDLTEETGIDVIEAENIRDLIGIFTIDRD